MKIIIVTLSIICITTLTSCNSSSEQEDTVIEKSMLAVATSSENPTEKFYYVNASSGLSLRSGTNLKSKKILTLPYGAQVLFLSAPEHTEMTVAGIKGEMIEIKYQGATGFTFNGYLTKLAPPQSNETLESYAKRISTIEHPINIIKIADKKGEDYGITTSIELPARSWNEAYRVSQRLFNLPTTINPDFSNKKTTVTIINKNKRERTQRDELTVNVAPNGSIKNLNYSYSLRDYERTIIIKKFNDGFVITEQETSR